MAVPIMASRAWIVMAAWIPVSAACVQSRQAASAVLGSMSRKRAAPSIGMPDIDFSW
jgi:hypothetical protein